MQGRRPCSTLGHPCSFIPCDENQISGRAFQQLLAWKLAEFILAHSNIFTCGCSRCLWARADHYYRIAAPQETHRVPPRVELVFARDVSGFCSAVHPCAPWRVFQHCRGNLKFRSPGIKEFGIRLKRSRVLFIGLKKSAGSLRRCGLPRNNPRSTIWGEPR